MSNLKAYWYCPYCRAEADPKSVNYEEEHVVCGTNVQWISGEVPKPEVIEEVDWKEFETIGFLTHWLNENKVNVIAAFQALHGSYRLIYSTGVEKPADDKEQAEKLQGYKEVYEDKDRLVRELDVIINGEEGAAKQASLCDIVSQLATEFPALRAENSKMRKALEPFIVAARHARNFPHPQVPVERLRAEATLAESNAESLLGAKEYHTICESAFKDQ